MDEVFFGLKRGHLAATRFSARLLFKFGLTPARFDLLRLVLHSGAAGMSQAYLRARLGVARSTVSRMLRALEQLGLVERDATSFDRRSRTCKLTVEGRSRVMAVMGELITTFVVAHAIDEALRCGRTDADPKRERAAAETICLGLVVGFAFERGTLAFGFD